MATTHKPDVTVRNEFTIIVLKPETEAGREWMSDNIQSEPWQWFGRGLVVEPRYAGNIIAGMIDAGLDVGEN